MPESATGTESTTLTLTTLDGIVLTIPCQPGMTVLKAAVAAGRRLPCLCWQGACGVCWASHVSGEYDHDDFNAQAIGPMAGERAVLLCRTRPRGDCSFDLPYEANRIVDSQPPVRRATITELHPVAHEVVRIAMRFCPDDVHGSAAEFDPGQFMQIEIPRPADAGDPGPYPPSRAYSMANCGNWEGDLEFYVHVQDRGKFSSYVRDRAGVGDVLTVHGPQGGFGLRERGLRPRWFVAGGTGVAPLLSMIRRMAEWGDPQPVRVYAGFTTTAHVFAAEALAELAATMPDFAATLCIWMPGTTPPGSVSGPPQGSVSGPPQGSPPGLLRGSTMAELAEATGLSVVAGTPAEVIARDLEGIEETPDFYLCGPPPMVQSVEVALAEAGIQPDHVEAERFTES